MSGYLWFVLGLFTGVSLLGVFNFFNTKFTKDQPIPKEGYNEHNLPKGCELIQVGDKYMFKIGDSIADMTDYSPFLCKHIKPNEPCLRRVEYVQKFCMTSNKKRCIKRGIETFEFFKALGKI
jgi:hypothetical protein